MTFDTRQLTAEEMLARLAPYDEQALVDLRLTGFCAWIDGERIDPMEFFIAPPLDNPPNPR